MIFKGIYLACDHAGLNLKQDLCRHLSSFDRVFQDLGPFEDASVDYPDYAEKMALALRDHTDFMGILICGTGIGMSIAVNRFPWVRAALCNKEAQEAFLARSHNDANVLCLGARLVTADHAKKVVDLFTMTAFEGGRHQGRIDKLRLLNES